MAGDGLAASCIRITGMHRNTLAGAMMKSKTLTCCIQAKVSGNIALCVQC